VIVCVTLNPALDKTVVVPALRRGEILRANETLAVAGGKGLNVARVVKRLGGAVECAGFLGGYIGQLVAALAQREGLPGTWTWIEGETRTCLIIVAAQGGEPMTIYELGPAVGADDWDRLRADVVRVAAAATAVCLSGSVPPGTTPEHFVALLRRLKRARTQIWVDTSGAALKAALDVPKIAIKVNHSEAGELVGRAVEQAGDALLAAREIHRHTRGDVAITLGARGAVLLNTSGSWYVQPPSVRAVSAVGSGDAFLAGLVMALIQGRPEPEALRKAAAVGAANALSVGGGQVDLDRVQAIMSRTTVHHIT